VKISADQYGILFTCDYCHVDAIIQPQKSKRAFMRHLNKFDREHHDCKFKFIRASSRKASDEIMAKLMAVK
jgi:hypothetical protein